MYDVDFIKDLILSAGKLALAHFLKVKPAWKENKTYVTDADLAVQAYIKRRLDTHYADDGIIAEEHDLQKPPTTGSRYWVIDPIDGTSAFAAGLPVWGIAIGLIEAGDPIGGFFLLPTTGDLFYTTPDGRAWRNDQPTHLKSPEPFHRESVLLTVSRFDREYRLSPAYPGKVRCLGSAIAHICYAAVGSVDAALVGDAAHIWDVAAGLALMAHNGGTWRYLNNTPVSLTEVLNGDVLPYPLLVGHPQSVVAFAELLSVQEIA